MVVFDYQKRFPRGAFLHLKGAFGACGITAVLGPSGSGKTTLARLLAGLAAPDAGRCVVNGTVFDDVSRSIRLRPEERGLGYVFQNHRLFACMSVWENILYPMRYGGRTPLMPLDELVQTLRIKPLLDRRPSTLSGGEAQRVSLARALCSAQRMLILDEPAASLDPELRGELVECVDAVARSARFPILYITHTAREALRLAPAALYLKAGRVVESGPTREILERRGYLMEAL